MWHSCTVQREDRMVRYSRQIYLATLTSTGGDPSKLSTWLDARARPRARASWGAGTIDSLPDGTRSPLNDTARAIGVVAAGMLTALMFARLLAVIVIACVDAHDRHV